MEWKVFNAEDARMEWKVFNAEDARMEWKVFNAEDARMGDELLKLSRRNQIPLILMVQ